MKRNLLLVSLVIVMIAPVPAHAFFDYVFSGGGSRDAIGNSVLGDMRSWWTGNPAYTFNPFYSPNPMANQGAQPRPSGQQVPGQGYSPTEVAPQAGYQQYQQPAATYYPPQGPAQYGQGYPQAMPQAAQQPQQWVQQPVQQPVRQPVQQPVQPYQGMPPGYPQGYSR